jgi:hypothetical protein
MHPAINREVSETRVADFHRQAHRDPRRGQLPARYARRNTQRTPSVAIAWPHAWLAVSLH